VDVKRGILVRWIGVVSCLTFVAGLFIGGAQPVAVGLVPAPWDKLAHLAAFGTLTFLVELALRPRPWLLVALPMVVSAADEIHQAYLPGRYASVEDWLAGAAGACIAYLVLRHTRLRDWITALES
jgi:VanZ family protein